ncbi:7216_t:CDS:10 [Diversispora eburnea]|uniref:DnaJ homolog 1, mitochondrial n=1 Tax=Diversispora eburnea TaxID=1213867 RepID=A0A9N8YMD8_9GLOM|nr:7216_t:CDS:10 [Diversispora eburnea]
MNSSYLNRLFHSSEPLRGPEKDYYELLGVTKNASQSDIKKAYYALAKKYHPDTNKDTSAKEKFVQVQEAYEVLSDEEKRAQYDQWGSSFEEQPTGAGGFSGGVNFEGFGFGNPPDIFEHVFGFGGPKASTWGGGFSTGPHVQLNIPFMEAVSGAKKTITIDAISTCKPCNGRGTKGGTKPDKCMTCKGSGVRYVPVAAGFQVQSTCPDCKGKGVKIRSENRCHVCGGQGQVNEPRQVTIDIPAVDDEMKMRIPRQGDVPIGRSGLPGDLIVRIKVVPHDVFKRQGNNIIVEAPVPFYKAILGGFIRVPTVDGDVELKIPPGSQPEQQALMKKRGIKSINSRARGDQIVIFKVNLPTSLAPKQKELIEEFVKLSGGFSTSSTTTNSKNSFLKKLFKKLKNKL